MTEQTPNWVAEHMCNLKAVFEELSRVVKRDVDEMKKIAPDTKITYHQPRQNGPFSVQDSDKETMVEFHKDLVNEKIRISTGVPNQTRHVAITWNAETSSCDLILDDDPSHVFKVWEVSKKALAPMFPS